MTAGIDHDLLNQVPGGTDLIAWFDGQVPSFHDAEVLELALDRVQSRCRVKIHAFRMTSETDTEGYFKCVKHVIVTFEFAHVCALELEGFNHQNAIYGLELLRLPNGRILMEMEPAYGLCGEIEAIDLQISLEPGIPPDSIYLARAARAT